MIGRITPADGLLLALAGLFVAVSLHAVHLFEFGDETEKVVAALMLGRGGRLYGDVFAHHGPVIYMLPHLWHLLTGATDVASFRALPMLLALAAAAAIRFSPAVADRRAAALAAVLYLVMIGAALPAFSLHMNLYQVHAGHFLVMGLALLVLPLMLGRDLPRPAALLGGGAFAGAVFSAYAMVPAVGLLVLAGAVPALAEAGRRGRAWRGLGLGVAGGLLGTLLVLGWLLLAGDVAGFLAYHLYFNQVIYSQFIGFSLGMGQFLDWLMFHRLAFGLRFEHLFVVLGCLAVLLVGWRLLQRQQTPLAAGLAGLALLFAGLLFTNPRTGLGFQAAVWVITAAGLFCLTLGPWLATRDRVARGSLAALLLMVAGAYGAAHLWARTSPHEVPLAAAWGGRAELGQSDNAYAALYRRLTPNGEPIQVMVFSPIQYIWAGRPPASGHYYYLPWQARYAEAPVLGRAIDLCGDLRRTRPPAVFYDDQPVWGLYDPDEYAPCLRALLLEQYVALGFPPGVWVRADVLAANPDLLATARLDRLLDFPWLDEAARQVLAQAQTRSIPRPGRLVAADGAACLGSPPAPGVPLPGLGCAGGPVVLEQFLERDGVRLRFRDDGRCLDVLGGAPGATAPVGAWDCIGVPNQTFSLNPAAGGVTVQARHSGLCLKATPDRLEQAPCAEATLWQWQAAEP